MSSYVQNGNSITVPRDSLVEYTVSLDGYYTQTNTIIADETKTIDVVLEYKLATLTINPTPSDAVVTLTADGYTQVGNSITVEKGTSVNCVVSKDGFATTTQNIEIIKDTTIDITLTTLPVLTINPTPTNAVVTLLADGYEQIGNSIVVNPGTNVTYIVECPNYYTQTDTIVVTETRTIDIILESSIATLTINPTPLYAVVTLTADGYTQVGNSITVEKGTNVQVKVEKNGYITSTTNIEVTSDITKNILLVKLIMISINPTPSDAKVTLTADGYTQVGNSIEVAPGVDVQYIVEKENYTRISDIITAVNDISIDVVLEYKMATLTINPTPSDAVVTLTADGYTQVGNSIFVEKGTNVQVKVEKDEFESFNDSIIVSKDTSMNIQINEIMEKIFKIITPQENAIIEFEVVNTDGIYSYNGEETINYSSN